MYIRCLIEWADDKSQEEVIIKEDDELIEELDDYIFFYGMSRVDLEYAKNNHELCEGEWYVIEIYGTTNNI